MRLVTICRDLVNKMGGVIGITDNVSSPLCAHCDPLFFIATETPQFFTSHAATLVLLESLIGMVVAKSSADVETRIASVEAKSHEIGDYFTDPTE